MLRAHRQCFLFGDEIGTPSMGERRKGIRFIGIRQKLVSLRIRLRLKIKQISNIRTLIVVGL